MGALPDGGRVVTLEREADAARIAASSWASSPHATKIVSLVGEACDLLADLAAQKDAFDLIFLDVDKPGYLPLYRLLMESGLLRVGGLLVVDNTMYKGEELVGERSENGKGARALNQELLASAALWAFEFVFLARWRSSLLPSTCCATDFVSQQLFPCTFVFGYHSSEVGNS